MSTNDKRTRELPKATQPFVFTSRLNLTVLTGRKARDLAELLENIKTAPGSVIYNHTHHFIQQHQYLSPEPPNDFAFWVTNVLQEDVLGEKLAAIDIVSFPTIRSLKEKIAATIEDYLNRTPNIRTAPEGEEFYFMGAITFVLPTRYRACDLREFCEALQKVSVHSLYFHIFEARLRLERRTNDFSMWFEDSLGEHALAQEVSNLDPYTHTLEGLRARICQMVQKRIEELYHA